MFIRLLDIPPGKGVLPLLAGLVADTLPFLDGFLLESGRCPVKDIDRPDPFFKQVRVAEEDPGKVRCNPPCSSIRGVPSGCRIIERNW